MTYQLTKNQNCGKPVSDKRREKSMSIIVFSDECGSWSDTSETLYIRSFICFQEDSYDLMCGKLHRDGVVDKIPKWRASGELRANAGFCNFLFEDARIFIALTDMEQFRRTPYKVRTAITRLDYDELLKDFRSEFDLKKDLVNKVNQLLFLNIYEREFLFRLKATLTVAYSGQAIAEFALDNPQHNNDDYEEMAKGVLGDISFSFIKDEKDSPGICIADLVAGCLRDTLLKKGVKDAEAFYVSAVRPKLIPGDKKNPNPSYQFWTNGIKEIQDQLVRLFTLK